jgi:hypothetical protein
VSGGTQATVSPRRSARPRTLWLLGAVGVLVCPRAALAETDHVFQSWTALFVQGRTAPGVDASPGVWLDVHARRTRDSTVSVLRPAFGYYFDRRFSVWAGYAFVPTFLDGAPDRFEHRPWEQLQAMLPWGDAIFMLRTRLEQRWVQQQDGLGWRGRQLVRWQHALGGDFAAVVWDEVFVGLNETGWGQPGGLDQNRAFVGFGWIPRAGVRLEPGYLSVWLPRAARDTLVHALSVNLFVWW